MLLAVVTSGAGYEAHYSLERGISPRDRLAHDRLPTRSIAAGFPHGDRRHGRSVDRACLYRGSTKRREGAAKRCKKGLRRSGLFPTFPASSKSSERQPSHVESAVTPDAT